MNSPSNAKDETDLLAALRRGDEAAFTDLVEQYHTSLVRLAMLYVHDTSVAEEVAQETWLAVLQGLERFEGRSSLKTWIYTILTNRAKTRSLRENRSLSFSDLGPASPDEPIVDPDRFNPPDHPNEPGSWAQKPESWNDPEQRLLSGETLAQVGKAIAGLPDNQRIVISLRDVDGFSSQEVCNILEISETNQRVLLHRARSKVRRALERYFQEQLS